MGSRSGTVTAAIAPPYGPEPLVSGRARSRRWRSAATGSNWALLNASPDLRQQLNETPQLHADPKLGLRHSPIKAAVLTNGDVDHIIGLINLREAQPFSIYASDRVLATLRANSVFQVLAEPLVPRIEIALDKPFKLEGAGVDLGLTVEAFAVPGKVALYLEDKSSSRLRQPEGDTIGLKITDPAEKKSFFYIPGLRCRR